MRRAFAALAVLVVVASSCGGDDDEEARRTTTTSTTAPTTTAPANTAPLTGVPLADAARRARPALIVKIDNDDKKSRPQIGLNQADVVFEEVVEGGVTRFATVFQSTDSDPVGPVRSARTSDLEIVKMLRRPLFAWSGANAGVAASIRQAPLVDVGVERVPGEYFRDRGRRAPSNQFTRTSRLFARGGGGQPPPALFRYRLADEAAAGQPVGGVRIDFGGRTHVVVEFRWDGGLRGWRRTQFGTPHVDGAGHPVAPHNVVVQFTQYRASPYRDVTGFVSPEAVLTGQGDVWVLTGGRVVRGRWSRAADGVTSYSDEDGRPIELTPGRTWVVLPGVSETPGVPQTSPDALPKATVGLLGAS